MILKLKMHKNAFKMHLRLGLCPGTHWGSLQLSTEPLARLIINGGPLRCPAVESNPLWKSLATGLETQGNVLSTHVCNGRPVIVGHTEPLAVTRANVHVH